MPFGDYPTNEARTIPYKWIGIIGGGIVLAVVIVGVVIRFIETSSSQNMIKTSEESLDALLANCETEAQPASCRQALVTRVIESSEGVAVCGKLKEKEADNCYWSFALNQHQPDFCSSVEDEQNAKKCFDSAQIELARATSDVSQCDKIEDAIKVRLCKKRFEPSVTSENCASLGHDASFCQSIAVLEKANQVQDPDYCNELGEQMLIASCKEQVSVDDPDFDGLATTDESLYASDPRNPDTDADGYKDGEEVASGFSPTGPGRLETTTNSEPFVLPF